MWFASRVDGVAYSGVTPGYNPTKAGVGSMVLRPELLLQVELGLLRQVAPLE